MDDDEAARMAVTGPPSPFLVPLTVDDESKDCDEANNIAKLLASAAAAYTEETQRTFLKYWEGKHYSPTADEINSRLDLQHVIAKKVLGGRLGLAPIDKPRRVLDLGTGTGIWAIEFAELYPKSQVVGTDISPVQPDRIPDNCMFRIADIEDRWNYDQEFDYIHGRYLFASLGDFTSLFKSIYANLAPGGWVEFQETLILFQGIDGTVEGTALHRWNALLLEGIQKMGRVPLSAVRCKHWMAEAGLVNIQERKFAVPMNTWAKGENEKALGALQMTNILEGLEAITTSVFVRALDWTLNEVQALLVEVRRDLQDRNIHGYVPMLVTWAQKEAQ